MAFDGEKGDDTDSQQCPHRLLPEKGVFRKMRPPDCAPEELFHFAENVEKPAGDGQV
jgi:hypothetical protein